MVRNTFNLEARKNRLVHSREAGFTMIEIMIVVVIIGILASMAFPSYVEYVRKSAATEAPTVLSDMRTKMEQYYLDNRKYGTGGVCGLAWSNPPTNTCPSGQTCTYFTYSCTTAGATDQTYLLTATGKTGSKVDGHVYTLTETNTRQTTQFKGVAVTKSCWLIGGSEC